MLINYFKIILRNLWRNKVFSLLNIIGLSIGMTACLFVFQFVAFEFSYDQFHPQKDNLYRLVSLSGSPDNHATFSSAPWEPTLKEKYPEVQDYTRLYVQRGTLQPLLEGKNSTAFTEDLYYV